VVAGGEGKAPGINVVASKAEVVAASVLASAATCTAVVDVSKPVTVEGEDRGPAVETADVVWKVGKAVVSTVDVEVAATVAGVTEGKAVDVEVAATVADVTEDKEVVATAVTVDGGKGAVDVVGAVDEVLAADSRRGPINVERGLDRETGAPAVGPREGKGKDDRAGVGTVTKVTGRSVAKGFGSVGCRLRGHHPFLTATLLSVKWKST
jgi:hypothetical protein